MEGSGGAGGSGAGAERRLARDDELADRAGLLAVVQEDRTGRARRPRDIDKDVGAAARRQHQRAVAGRERLGRLAVDGHHADLEFFQFDRKQQRVGSH